jgi:hypothetical protein
MLSNYTISIMMPMNYDALRKENSMFHNALILIDLMSFQQKASILFFFFDGVYV